MVDGRVGERRGCRGSSSAAAARIWPARLQGRAAASRGVRSASRSCPDLPDSVAAARSARAGRARRRMHEVDEVADAASSPDRRSLCCIAWSFSAACRWMSMISMSRVADSGEVERVGQRRLRPSPRARGPEGRRRAGSLPKGCPASSAATVTRQAACPCPSSAHRLTSPTVMTKPVAVRVFAERVDQTFPELLGVEFLLT